MEATTGEQLYRFFLSCGFGFILGIYYDVFRVYRLVMRPGKTAVFLQDVIFFLTSAIFTFLFSLVIMTGQLRLYLFVGEIIGFFAYYYTIGAVVSRTAAAAVRAAIRAWRVFWIIISAPFRFVGRLLRRPAGKIGRFFEKKARTFMNILKKGLKHALPLLYNHKESKMD